MSEPIFLTIDDTVVSVEPEATILQAATRIGIRIPTMCYHKATTSCAICRLCVVEVEGSRALIPSCVASAGPGMVVHTRTARVERVRRTILEMLASSIDLSEAFELQAHMRDYSVDITRYSGCQRRCPPILDDNPMYIRDYAKCVLCWRCVQVCAEDAQYTYAINFSGRGFETLISTFYDRPIMESTCVFCGQCLGVCPTNALKPKREWLLEQGQSLDEIIETTRIEKRTCMSRLADPSSEPERKQP